MSHLHLNGSTSLTTKVIFDQTEINLSFCKSASFTDFDSWVRGRFGLKNDDKVIYKNKSGCEIIPFPGGEWNQIFVEKLSDKVEASLEKQEKSSSHLWNLFVIFVPPTLLLLLAIALSCKKVYFSYIFPTNIIDSFFHSIGLSNWRTRCIESYIAFLTWSITYLFIRRGLNPETSNVAIQKFPADAVYGGLAAAVSIFLKYALKAVLLT